MIARQLQKSLRSYAKFPVVALLGPRQSGKTTLAKATFPDHAYASFEDPDTRDLAQNDPRKFFEIYQNEHGIIIDEFQYVPQILSYIQLEVDEKKRPGYFVLTGSQNFLMNQAITQSLAGRVGILTLHTLALEELASADLIGKLGASDLILRGGYPRIWAEGFAPTELYPSYIQSYLERDVRSLTQVGDLRSFQKFMQLCAGRVGQLLNLSDIATSCGISVPTASRWISILETSYIVFLLQPYYRNFNKRLTKSPKLYFYDTGLVCTLLGIETTRTLDLHPLFGSVFENFIISDFAKQYSNRGKRAPLYFWRDLNGRVEVDCLIEDDTNLIPVEIKSGQTINSGYFDGLKQWDEIAQTPATRNYLVYGGDQSQERSAGNLVAWRDAGMLIELIRKGLK